MKSAWLCVAIGSCLAGAPAAAADWGVDVSAGVAHDDNAPNALEAADRKTDTAATLNLSAGLHNEIMPGTGLGLSLIAESSTSPRYAGLSNLGLGARMQLREKFGLGAAVPWAALSIGGVHRDFHDDNRDGWQYDAGLSAGKRLDERWSVRAAARYDRYVADTHQPQLVPGVSADAYDVSGYSFGAGASFLVTEADTLSLNASWRDGSVTAVTHPDLEVLEYADAAVRDTVFAPNGVAYRIQARTTTLSLNWNHVLSRGMALNFGYAYRRSNTDTEIESYYSNLLNFSITYSQ